MSDAIFSLTLVISNFLLKQHLVVDNTRAQK